MQYFGLVSFLFKKNLYKTGSVCESMGPRLMGEVSAYDCEKGESGCSIGSWCKVLS